MSATIDIINLGVRNVHEAREFYERGFGGVVEADGESPLISFGRCASRLALRGWEAVAADAGVNAASDGFRGFTLSYIVDSADAVDAVLDLAQRHGGRISKPPKNAVWGYSAYVTDPGGYLWKVASSKRRPLRAHKASTAAGGPPTVAPKELPITIGVADMKQAKEFYKDGLGLPVKKAFGNKFVMFSGEDGRSDLGMYKRAALADDAAVKPEGSGFHGFSITHVVESTARVDELLGLADRAGGQIVKAPAGTDGRAYSGCFADLDGNVWQVATHH